MTAASNSVVELTSDVNASVEKLQELGAQLQVNRTEFAQKFCEDAFKIIDALKELDSSRLKAHERLEAETITASVLRHRLNTHASKLRNEATATVGSARDSNAAQIKELKDQLEWMSHEATRLVKKHEVLDLHNDMLIPDLKKIKTDHEDKVKKLNEKMSERASMQILLNETDDQLKTTNDRISSLESEISILEEELKQRIDEVNKEKDKLLKTLDVTKVKLNEQNRNNFKSKKELRELEDETVESQLSLQETCRNIHEIEATIKHLINMEENLKVTIHEQEKEIESQKNMEIDIESEMNEQKLAFTMKRKECELIIEQLIREVKIATQENSKLIDSRKKIKKKLKEANDISNMQSGALSDIKRSVDASKKILMDESKDGVRLDTEKKELEYRLISLRETHKVNVQLFKEEIAELREKLTKERKTRQTVEESYNDLQITIQHHLTQNSEVIASLTATMNESKTQRNEMADKSAELELEVSNYEHNIIALQQELESTVNSLDYIRNDMEYQITNLEESIAELTEDLYDHTEMLLQLEPESCTLENEYTLLSEQYESKKKDMIGLKNKKSGLEDACQRLQRDLEKMYIPQDMLRMETLTCRAYTRQSLRNQKKKIDEMERDVWEREKKLEYIMRENQRFNETIEYLKSDCTRLSAMYENSTEIEIMLINKLKVMKESLEIQWKENQDLAKHYSECDRVSLEKMETLDKNCKERLQMLSVIATQFQQEMMNFTDYLSKMARPRTKI